jgi:hypothetical protein
MVTLAIGITFLPFPCMNFLCREIYEGGPCVRRPPMKWSAMAENLRNTALSNWENIYTCIVT